MQVSWPIKNLFLFFLGFNAVKHLNQDREQGMGIETLSLIHLCIHLTNTLLNPAYVPDIILGAGNTVGNTAETILMVWNLYSNGGVGHDK